MGFAPLPENTLTITEARFGPNHEAKAHALWMEGLARMVRQQEERDMLATLRITASGPAALSPEAAAVIREIKAACVALVDAPGPYHPSTPAGNRTARRAAASRARR